MKELRTIYPYGLNDRCNGTDWTSKNSEFSAMSIFNKLKVTRRNRGKIRRNKWSSTFSLDNFLKELLRLFNSQQYWMNYCRKTIASLSKKMLKSIALRLSLSRYKMPDLIYEVLSDIFDFKCFNITLFNK